MTTTPTDIDIGDLTLSAARREIVFIVDNVTDLDTLVQGVGAGKEVVILDASRDGLRQIAETLAGRSGIDALHILSHGAGGTIDLGALQLSSANLEAQRDTLMAIGSSMREGGDILFYGCDIGAGRGADLVGRLAIATGADVAASNNLTGAHALGGDWGLELASGAIEAASVVDAQLAAHYSQVLSIAHATYGFGGAPYSVPSMGSGASPNITNDTLAPAAPLRPELHPDSDSGTKADGITNAPVQHIRGLPGSAEAGSVLSLYTSGSPTPLGSVSVGADGSWSIALELNEGTHTLYARTVDAAGNESGASPAWSLTVDRTGPVAPAAPLLAAASNTGGMGVNPVTSDSTPTFTGAAGSVGANATVRLFGTDGVTILGSAVAALDGSWSITSTTLASGAHTITARTYDVAGNESPASSGFGITIDATPPAAPSTPDLAASSDTGNSNTDNVTGDTTPSFIGTAEPGATVVLLADGRAVGSAQADAQGNWSITVDQALVGGEYLFEARASDLAGNTSPHSGELVVSVITAPAAYAVDMRMNQDTGIDGDRVTNVAVQTLAGSTSFALQAGEKVQVNLGQGWVDAVFSAGSPNWQLAGQTLAQGEHQAQVRVVKEFGIPGREASFSYTLDTVAPAVAITSNVASLKIGETATITFTFSEAVQGFSAADISVVGGTLGPLSGSGLTYTAIFTPDAGVDRTNASITVAAGAYTDLAGNNGTAGVTPVLSVDTLARTPSAPVLDSASDTGSSNADGVTANNLPTFTGTGASGDTVVLFGADGAEVGRGVVADGKWAIVPGAALADGVHSIGARSLDAAGNLSPLSGAVQITVDTQAPTVTIGSDVASLKAGETATITFTFSKAVQDFSAADIGVVGGTLGPLSGSGLSYTATFTPDAGVDRTDASITVAAGAYTDLAGNSGTAGVTPVLSVDTLARTPSAPVLDSASDTGSSNADGVTANNLLTFTGTGASGDTVILFGADGAELGRGVVVDGKWAIVPGAALADGVHSIGARSLDAAGNLSPLSGALHITIDTQTPTVTIGSSAASLKTGETATITFTFSEAVQDFSAAGISVVGGTLGPLSGSGLSYTATFTPDAGVDRTDASITIAAGAYTDLAGNSGTAGVTPVLSVDTLAATPPAPRLAAASDTGTVGEGITESSTQVIEGSGAEPEALIRLFNGAQ